MPKFIGVISLAKIQLFWGVHLASQIGAYVTSSNTNVSGQDGNIIPVQHIRCNRQLVLGNGGGWGFAAAT